jgi:hypothetical protein
VSQENVATRLAYKFYSSGTISANSEADRSTDPGASGAQEIRRVTSTLALKKDSYESNETASHRQVTDMRHGTRRPSGEISGELSLGTYFDFMEAACRGTKSSAISKSESDFTSLTADNATAKLTVGASTWAAQGFRVGDVIRPANLSVAANNRNFIITALSGTEATVDPAPTDMTADTAFTVATVGKKVTIPTSGHVSRKVAIEHYHDTPDITQLFTEARITGMSIQAPASGLCTVSFPVVARNEVELTSGDAPYFSSPTAVNTNGITAAVNGRLLFNGTSVGVVTGFSFTLQMSQESPPVVGQDFVPDIFLGRSKVTGQMTALFTDSTFLDAFNDETEVSLILMLTVDSTVTSDFIAFTMPRVKLSSADIALQGEGGLPINCTFQALLKASATGFDNTTLTIQDSLAA